MRAVCLRAGIRQLPERLYQPYSSRPIGDYAWIPLPGLPGTDSLVSQSSAGELADAARPMPGLRRTHSLAIPSCRTPHCGSIHCLLRMVWPDFADPEILRLQLPAGGTDFHGCGNRPAATRVHLCGNRVRSGIFVDRAHGQQWHAVPAEPLQPAPGKHPACSLCSTPRWEPLPAPASSTSPGVCTIWCARSMAWVSAMLP